MGSEFVPGPFSAKVHVMAPEWTSCMYSNCRISLCRMNTSPERAKQPLSCRHGTSHGSGQTLTTCLENLEMWELSKGVPTTNPYKSTVAGQAAGKKSRTVDLILTMLSVVVPQPFQGSADGWLFG